MTSTSERFENYIKRFGYKVIQLKGSEEIRSVSYKGFHLFTIPARMYSFPIEKHRPQGLNMMHPSYHELLAKARYYWYLINLTNWFLELREEGAKQRFNPNYDEE